MPFIRQSAQPDAGENAPHFIVLLLLIRWTSGSRSYASRHIKIALE